MFSLGNVVLNEPLVHHSLLFFWGNKKSTHKLPPNNWSTQYDGNPWVPEVQNWLQLWIEEASPPEEQTNKDGATWRHMAAEHGGTWWVFFLPVVLVSSVCVFFFSGRWWRFQRKKEAKAESWMAVFTEFFWSKWISLLFGNPLVKGVFQFMKYCNIKAQRGPVLWSWKETSWIILRIAAGKMLVADMSPGPTKTYKNATDFFMNLALLCLGSKLYILQYSILSILYNVYISTVYILQ